MIVFETRRCTMCGGNQGCHDETCNECGGSGVTMTYQDEPEPPAFMRPPACEVCGEKCGWTGEKWLARCTCERHGEAARETLRPAALFAFFRDGQWLHTHSDVGVFERWVKNSPWCYPPERCHVVKYEPTCTVSGEDLKRASLTDLTGDAAP